MKMTRWSRQALFSVTILLFLLSMLAMLALVPVSHQLDRYAVELLRDARMLQQFKGVAAIKDEIDQAGVLFARRDLDQWVYSDRPVSEVALDIQRRVTDVINQNEAVMGSVAPQPVRTRGEQLNVGVRVRFSGSMSAVLATFASLEHGQPLLLLEDVRLVPERVRVRRGEPEVQQLSVEMTVSTLIIATEAAAGGEGA